ncbi:hypothetical protein L2E82_47867 [Cichorium intybus]|uniref:Uncharacterized protein n=1 Tax=Cichorium intybus TaxID=13427 RepID=A0ACB8YWK2_CICIN|nr:hypothetical protein L2E82_47867 [Cichorium intybus]
MVVHRLRPYVMADSRSLKSQIQFPFMTLFYGGLSIYVSDEQLTYTVEGARGYIADMESNKENRNSQSNTNVERSGITNDA